MSKLDISKISGSTKERILADMANEGCIQTEEFVCKKHFIGNHKLLFEAGNKHKVIIVHIDGKKLYYILTLEGMYLRSRDIENFKEYFLIL